MRTFALTAMGVSTALAGPISPPVGPIDSTPRFGPRVEINATSTPGDADSHFRISEPGSYYLGANVKIPDGLVGIEIASSNVYIDLNGFNISSVSFRGSPIAIGVEVDPDPSQHENVVIQNGTISNCDTAIDGIRFEPGESGILTACRVEGISVSDCTFGLDMFGFSHVSACVIRVDGVGITISAGSVRDTSVSTFAAGFGVSAEFSSLSNVSARTGDVGFKLVSCSASNCAVLLGATGFDATDSMMRGCYVVPSVATDYVDNGGNTTIDNSF